MMRDYLFNLLPAIYRFHDERQGSQLKAYLRVLDAQLEDLETDTLRIYDNNFVETCEPWVLPYLGQLVGLNPLDFANIELSQQRSRVGNALAFARRKGTHAALEKVLSSATGWGIRVVVNQRQINTTQSVRAPMGDSGRLVDLRGGEASWVGTSFEQSSRCVGIRGLTHGPNGSGQGGNQPANVGIHIWRLKSFYLDSVRPCAQPGGHFFRASPIDRDRRFYKLPVPWRDLNRLADIGTLPGPLFSGPLESADEFFRAELAMGTRFLNETIFRRTHYTVSLDGRPIPLEHVRHFNLEPWPNPADLPALTSNTYPTPDGSSKTFPIEVYVDVTHGRLAFPHPVESHRVHLSWAYGSVSELGGGPYHRAEGLLPTSQVEAFVCRNGEADPRRGLFNELADALSYGLLDTGRPAFHTIRILDNDTYQLPEQAYELWPNQQLAVEAANGHRPCLRGQFHFHQRQGGGLVSLDGLLLHGSIRISGGDQGTNFKLTLNHMTLLPGTEPTLEVLQNETTPALHLTCYHSIVGALRLAHDLARLDFQDSIVDGTITSQSDTDAMGFAIAAFQRCTVLGSVQLRELALATNSLFLQPVLVRQRNVGQVRFCYYPEGSLLPSAFECLSGEEQRPRFESTSYDDEAYCQLSQAGPARLLDGAEDGGELGAYHLVGQGRRLAALKQVLEEHLPFGLIPDTRFVS